MIDKSHIETIILAGGKSSRMGTEKGLVQWKDKCFIEHVIDAVKHETNKLSIVTNQAHYDYLGYKTYPDIVQGKGPLSGIHTGLTHATHPYVLFVSCDLPLISRSLIGFLRSNLLHEDILVPTHHGITEPLCGIYSRRCARLVGGLVKHNRLGIIAALRFFNTKYLDISGEDFFERDMLTSINSPADLEKLKSAYHVSES